MLSERLRNPRYQSDFYKHLYHKILNALIVSSIIIILLIGAIIYFILFKSEPNYYATSITGQLIPISRSA